ncbi:hypothetical protein evm_013451 [Chilo suppressalis]|nr:hypothetical protein evm_013451 [Chilo suppressalis]
MRVNLAAQVLSHSVAAGMFARISQGLLPGEASVTADIISNIDKLFDCLNGDTADRKKGKPHCTNMTDTSPHFDHFKKMIEFFDTCEFVGCHSSPPSKQGWIWTIRGVIKVYNNLKRKHNIKALCTRRLQQDPLENLFGTIRGNCGANFNPTSIQFIAGLKTAILSNLAHMGSGNYMMDDCSSIADFKEILKATTCTATDICTETPQVSNMLSLIETSFQESVSDSQELQACAYVCGFMLKNLVNNNCNTCDLVLKAKNTDDVLYTFIDFKEYDCIKKRLNYASEEFIRCVENCASLCNKLYEMSSYSLNLKKQVVGKLTAEINFNFLKKCEEHFSRNVTFICNSVFQITIKRYCIIKNRQFSDSQKLLKRKIDILKNK